MRMTRQTAKDLVHDSEHKNTALSSTSYNMTDVSLCYWLQVKLLNREICDWRMYERWQVTRFLGKKDECGLSEAWRMMMNADTCQVRFFFFLTHSYLLENHRCLQVCWCSSDPGWRTRMRGPRGCPLLPCSPCNHQSHPWHWRRSWSWYQTGLLQTRTSCRMHGACHLTSDQVALPEIQKIFTVKGHLKRNMI